MALNWLR